MPTQLVRDADQADPDVRVTDHPALRVFAGQRNSFLSVAKVDIYYALDPKWSPPTTGDVRVLARLRNGAPFVIEKRVGEGRVVVQLCKLSPKPTELGPWSNWSLNPVFPVYANELVGYLSAARRRFDDRDVGTPLRLSVPESDYLPEVRVQAPGVAERGAVSVIASAKDGQYQIEAPGDAHSGVWQFQFKKRDGKDETRTAAVNVPTGEGDLHRLDREALAEHLRGIDYEFSLASQFSETEDQLAGTHLGDALLYLLIAALVSEQLLAYSASYHPRGKGAAA